MPHYKLTEFAFSRNSRNSNLLNQLESTSKLIIILNFNKLIHLKGIITTFIFNPDYVIGFLSVKKWFMTKAISAQKIVNKIHLINVPTIKAFQRNPIFYCVA